MPPPLLALVCALLVALSARAAPSEPVVAIAAVPLDPGVPPAVRGHLGGLWMEELARAGFQLLDPRQVDLRLAEHVDLLARCQRMEDEPQTACVREQARLLGVSRVVLPRVRPLAGGLGLSLTLFSGDVPERLERQVEVAQACMGCQGAALRASVARLAQALRRSHLRTLAGQLEVLVTPPEARVLVDGQQVGRGLVRLELPPGEHVVVAEGPTGRSEQRVRLAARRTERVELVLPAPRPRPPGGRSLRVAKWALAGLGVGLLVAGTALWALDGQPTCERAMGQTRCPDVLDTAGAGIGLFVGGALALGSSAVLFGIDHQRRQEVRQVAVGLFGRF
ncbi:MAG: hypothetical protein RMK29_17965 [Myxococcales bacterium]|nr:hypothetical protein [Myxococcota bacterium]MDW8283597.1 hypothetical protein [Myxococcales bacterium]